MEEAIETLADKVYFNKPSLMMRIKSMLIDGLAIIAIMTVMSIVLESFEFVSDTTRMICLALVILYEPVFISLGGTIGQRLMGVHVGNFSSFKSGKPKHSLNIGYSIFRYIVKLLLGWVSLLTIHSSSYGQAIHDKVGNSIVTFR